MLKSLIEKAVRVADDAGVETVLTLAFVAQVAASALPLYGAEAVHTYLLVDARDTGTVLQMPANPSGPRAGRAVIVRETKSAARAPAAAASKAAQRVRRPDPVDDTAGDDLEAARQTEDAVRITIIGPDGAPRTKVVRRSGSRGAMAAPARRPHD